MCFEVFGDDKVIPLTSGSELLYSAKTLSQKGKFFGTDDQLTEVENELVYLAKSYAESNLIQWTARGVIMNKKSTLVL